MKTMEHLVLDASAPTQLSIAIAACRAGAWGIIDAEFVSNPERVNESLRRLQLHGKKQFGIKLGLNAPLILPSLAPCLAILLAGGDHPNTAKAVSLAKRTGAKVFVEAVSLAEVELALRLEVDGIVLKGQEAGGRIGCDTAFILVQKTARLLKEKAATIPFWVQGGMGAHSAGACVIAGAAGVVLDSQLLLALESPVASAARARIAKMDGGETIVIGSRLGQAFRMYGRPDSAAAQELAREEERILALEGSPEHKKATWLKAVARSVADDPSQGAWLIGQEIGFAQSLASTYATVSGILQGISARIEKQKELAGTVQPFAQNSPFALAQGTKYPILQGPMTRVSDIPEFADAVAHGGGLPFLALALFRREEARKVMGQTKEMMKGRPWGVGMLGFAPAEIRAEQLEAIFEYNPPFAIIAGGRPDQAKELESKGIKTYLHVPSPGLLRMYLKDGARRFIFEGHECGGHVGPRSSFSLWNGMLDVLEDHLRLNPGEDLSIVFAGGIHDGLSAAMVAAMCAPLTLKKVKAGVLVGTAYLFTHEAVKTGAITSLFQKEALACGDTVLLETGPGHAIRCIPNPYAQEFESEKRKLRNSGKTPLEVGLALERMNLGRLRVASKGVDRTSRNGVGPGLHPVSQDDQWHRGMYMIGQVAALRDRVTSILELHEGIASGLADQVLPKALPDSESDPLDKPCDVAIVGLSCFYPGATTLWGYWENILAKANAVTEVPASHWDWSLYYDPDPRAPDKSISKWGGFMADVPFDPLKYGITPKSIPNIEPLQLLLLEAVDRALADAGYANRPFNRERTCAILGTGGGGMPLSVSYGFRACMPLMDTIPGMPVSSSEVVRLGKGILPEWTEDSFPGILLNVAAGRVANRFNLGGPNMAIDAACGSSLAALHAGVRELTTGSSDVAVVMGGDAVQTPFAYVAFSKTHALSPKGRCRPFDAEADGIALAEGVGVAILKRLADAERDGDRIYAVIKGVGASSDGRDKGLTAPRAEGQVRALRRAYAQAQVSPAHLGLIEAHGTGTVVGDQTEAGAIGQFLAEAGGQAGSCAIGSVKSMIGHSKCAAGLAGLVKTAMALHHKVLPPTLVEKPNPRANWTDGPLFLNSQTRPWVHGAEHPRTAGVSAFGFGGTNFHAVLEEYRGDYLDRTNSGMRSWPVELLLFRRPDRQEITQALKKIGTALQEGATPELRQLAQAIWQSSKQGSGQATLALLATSLDDLKEKLAIALELLAKPEETFSDPRGLYFAQSPVQQGKIAFLFPGQGSQYPDMLAQLAIAFPEVRQVIDLADQALQADLDAPLGHFIYPPSAFTSEQEQASKKQLQRAEVAQPAIGAASLAMYKLLGAFGIEPDMLGGHSYGEYTALAASGAMGESEFFRLSHRRGMAIKEAAEGANSGGMIAAEAPVSRVETAIDGLAEVWIANLNSPLQTVIAGSEKGLKDAAAALQTSGIRFQRLPVACAFHSPLIADASAPLGRALGEVRFSPMNKPVYSNASAQPHDLTATDVGSKLVEHLLSPVRFVEEIGAMHAAGARLFIEVGPQGILTGLTDQILAGQEHLALASDMKSRPGVTQLAHLLGRLAVAGVSLNLDRLFAGRDIQPLDLSKLGPQTGKPVHTPTTWVVNGVRSRPLNGPEPRLLGQRLPEGVKSAATSVPAVKASGAMAAGTKEPIAIPVAQKPDAKVSQPVPAVSASHQPDASKPLPAAPAPRPVAAPSPVVTNPTSPIPQTSSPRSAMSNRSDPSKNHQNAQNGFSSMNQGPAGSLPQGSAEVMVRFQEVMSRFLETQRSVMLGYLGAADSQPMMPPAALPAPSLPALRHAVAPTQPMAAVSQAMPAAKKPAATVAVNPAPVVAPKVVHPEAAPRENAVASPSMVPNMAPAAIAAASSAEPKKAGAAKLDRETLLARMTDLVSDHTGYPKEALNIDLDLEADLGVDSIKRVEILGTLADEIVGNVQDGPPALEMEKLSSIKTLRGIAEYLLEALSPSAEGDSEPQSPTPAAPEKMPEPQKVAAKAEKTVEKPIPSAPAKSLVQPAPHPAAGAGEIQRLVLRLTDAPLPAKPRFSPLEGTILITDDRMGTAQELANRLGELDIDTTLVRMSGANGAPEGAFAADLTDPKAVEHLLAVIRSKRGRVAGLIHLLPLAEKNQGEQPEIQAQREVKSLYLLAKGLEKELRGSSKSGAAFLMAVTSTGGTLGFGPNLAEEFSVGHGGVAGFAKCLKHEWPEVAVRVVDLDPQAGAMTQAEMLFRELGALDGPAEIGVRDKRRVTWKVESGPLPAGPEEKVHIDRNSTILITGGARGITAKVALELARRYKPRLVLVGSTPLPVEESPDTFGLTAPGEIKAALLARLGAGAKPAAAEAEYKRLQKSREIRRNLEAISVAGSKVEYQAIDVRDAAAMGALIDSLTAQGAITGVIHGAGIIEDKLLKDKTPESFDRVFRTKVDSALILARLLDPKSIKFFSLFSSIASRFGNRGQSDYAAANEALSKLASDLDRRWPGRVFSIAWGPWAEVGMVADLEKHLVARGLRLISTEVGSKFAVDEIVFGSKGEPEVLIAGGNEKAVNSVQEAHIPQAPPTVSAAPMAPVKVKV